jgi:lambda repressor-like predicted transcriptional regulator
MRNKLKDKASAAISYAGMTKAEVARSLDLSPQSLNGRLDRLSLCKFERIADSIGARFEAHFVFDDGTRI